jgi:hypothetical protein
MRLRKFGPEVVRRLGKTIIELRERLAVAERKAESQIDWSKTPAYERAFFNNLIMTIDHMAARWASDVADLENSTRELFGRLCRKEAPQ